MRIDCRILGLIILGVISTPLNAGLVTYEYTGNTWDSFNVIPGTFGPDGASEGYVEDYLYADQRFISGFVTIDVSKLSGGTNLNTSFWLQGVQGYGGSPAMIDAEFFDGVYSYPGGPAGVWSFQFTTDSEGNISEWDVVLLTGPAPTDILLNSQSGDLITDFGRVLDISFNRPGTWVMVPEPGTLALLGLGLVGMGYARRRKAN